MPALSFELILASILLLFLPAMLLALYFVRRGDLMALRRLLFILPGQLVTGAALLAGINAMEVDDPDKLVIAASSLLGLAGALVCLMCHQIARI